MLPSITHTLLDRAAAAAPSVLPCASHLMLSLGQQLLPYQPAAASSTDGSSSGGSGNNSSWGHSTAWPLAQSYCHIPVAVAANDDSSSSSRSCASSGCRGPAYPHYASSGLVSHHHALSHGTSWAHRPFLACSSSSSILAPMWPGSSSGSRKYSSGRGPHGTLSSQQPCMPGSIGDQPLDFPQGPLDSLSGSAYGSGSSLAGSSLGPMDLTAAALGSTAMAAGMMVDAASVQEASWQLFQHCAFALEVVHTATGLPWWASLPLCTLSVKTLLLPVSLRQARIVRSNYVIYKEALQLTDKQMAAAAAAEALRQQQQGQQPPTASGPVPTPGASASSSSSTSTTTTTAAAAATGAAAGAAAAGPPAAAAAAGEKGGAPAAPAVPLRQRLERSQQLLHNFNLLRGKCDTPHPVWILVNPLLQVPVFVVLGITIRMMCNINWPGLSSQGTLWFPDLTLGPMVYATGEMPLGWPGLIMPFAILAITLTIIRNGVGAAGFQQSLPSDDVYGRFVRALPPLMYFLAVAHMYIKLQAPHGVLLHWMASTSFTLGLQLAMREPFVQKVANMPTVQKLQEVMRPLLAEEEAVVTAEAVDPAVLQRIAATNHPDVLTIMGAQRSALKRYREALLCFDKALTLDPRHVRAHYSLGQVHSLQRRWGPAQAAFQRAAEVAEEPNEKGQALYCLAMAQHSQGQLSEAVESYRASAALWGGQPVVLFGLANALRQAGRPQEAWEVLLQAEQQDQALPGRPFRNVLERMKGEVEKALGGAGTGLEQSPAVPKP